MKKIGVLFGMENTFPGALVEKINAKNLDGISAEFVQIGAIRLDQPPVWSVIVDRISHDIPFYRAFLKHAVLNGTTVINNPFWWSADDKFFNYSLAARLGVAAPATVILPHKHYPPGTTDRSMRNLEYPLDWEGVFQYIGFPAFLKPVNGGGWRDVHHVHNREQFYRAYDESRDLCMMLQKAVNFTEYFRCYVVGQEKVRIMAYDPRRPHAERYVRDGQPADSKLLQRVEEDALKLCRALGYDLNTVEFAVENGVPYAIDFMNPAPDADLHSVGRENFEWIVDAVAELAIQKATNAKAGVPEFHWSAYLAGGTKPAAKTAAKKKSADLNKTDPKKTAPKKAAAKKSTRARAAAAESQDKPDDIATVSAAE